MFNPLKPIIKTKIAEHQEKKQSNRMVNCADKMNASEINDVMTAIGLPQFAYFQ